jgi:hypothetical protein
MVEIPPHDFIMPHDTRFVGTPAYPIDGIAGCPPNCPRRLAVGIETANEFGWGSGTSMVNSTAGQTGLARWVAMVDNYRCLFDPTFRTKQRAFRYAAWLVSLAEVLPDEPGDSHTFEEILEAIRNT